MFFLMTWRLDFNRHRRAGLKEAYCRIGGLRRLVGVEAEVILGAPANRVGVLISRRRFRVPGDRACVLGNIPRCAAIPSVSLRPIMCPTRMLRRGVKANVTYVNSGAQGPAEGLNCAVEVHVEERIHVVPDSRRRVSYVVAYKPKQELASSRFTNH
jgi:hypothetical protein